MPYEAFMKKFDGANRMEPEVGTAVQRWKSC
jgi:hypothetical protein